MKAWNELSLFFPYLARTILFARTLTRFPNTTSRHRSLFLPIKCLILDLSEPSSSQLHYHLPFTLMKTFWGITYLTFLAALRRVCLLGASSSSSSSSEESCFFLFPRCVLGCFLTRGLGIALKWEKKKWRSPYFIICCLLQIYITVISQSRVHT